MSRLDFFTLLIVGVLLFALGFLVYRATQLPNEQNTEIAEQKSPPAAHTQETPAVRTPAQDSLEDNNAGADEDPDDDEAPPVQEEVLTEKTPTATAPEKNETQAKPRDYDSSGGYLVISGSFKQKSNAEAQVRRLKKAGYNNSEVTTFNRGALAVAMVDRFSSYEDAERLLSELKSKGFDAFIKKKD